MFETDEDDFYNQEKTGTISRILSGAREKDRTREALWPRAMEGKWASFPTRAGKQMRV
jgi:hypothetical protein